MSYRRRRRGLGLLVKNIIRSMYIVNFWYNLQWRCAGFNRFGDDIAMMIGHRPNYYWLVCWVAVTPGMTWVINSALLQFSHAYVMCCRMHRDELITYCYLNITIPITQSRFVLWLRWLCWHCASSDASSLWNVGLPLHRSVKRDHWLIQIKLKKRAWRFGVQNGCVTPWLASLMVIGHAGIEGRTLRDWESYSV